MVKLVKSRQRAAHKDQYVVQFLKIFYSTHNLKYLIKVVESIFAYADDLAIIVKGYSRNEAEAKLNQTNMVHGQ